MLRGKAARTYPMMDASQRVNTTLDAPRQEYRVCRLFLSLDTARQVRHDLQARSEEIDAR